jgi:hypothetical protein
MIMVMTSRVISPQYLVWLLAVGAICLMSRDTTQRRSCLLFLIALPVTQLEFPFEFHQLWHGHTHAIVLVVFRNLLLIAAMVVGFRDLWRGSVTGPLLPRRPTAGGDTVAAADDSGRVSSAVRE